MTTWSFIGSGNIGSAIARLAVAAGHHVIMSNSRGPQTLADLVAELGPLARAATPHQAAAAGDIAVATIPMSKFRDVPIEELRGKIVIDTMNYYPFHGSIAELETGAMTSSELLQKHLADSYVVKAFNSMHYRHIPELAQPSGAASRSAFPIAGDDEAAKVRVRGLLDALGFDVVDIGALADSWRIQPGTPAFAWLYAASPPGPASEGPDGALQRLAQGSRPAYGVAVQDAVAAAVRREL